MEQWEGASPAVRSAAMCKAVCWECGQDLECFEYIVCCTGTLFHICPACEAAQKEPAGPEPEPAPMTDAPFAAASTPAVIQP